MRTNIRSEYENGKGYYPLLQAARMIESELRSDPQYKTDDKVDSKSDKKVKAKGAASVIDVDLSNLKKVCDETVNEMKAMKKTIQDMNTCIGHLQQNRPTNLLTIRTLLTKGTTPKEGEGGSIRVEGVEWKVKTFIKTDLPLVGGVRAM